MRNVLRTRKVPVVCVLWSAALVSCLFLAQGARAGARPEPARPVASSHGHKVRTASNGFCPRNATACNLTTALVSTRKRVPVSRTRFVRLVFGARVSRMRIELGGGCGHASKPQRVTGRRWRFRVSRQVSDGKDRCRDTLAKAVFPQQKHCKAGTGWYGFATRPAHDDATR
jgi:hypothetical protein